MPNTRHTLAAAGLALALGATPALAQDQSAATGPGEGYETQVLRSDTWKPGYTKTDGGDYTMIVPETQDEADGMPMTVVRSDKWKPGYVKSDDGDYILLAPAEEAKDESVRILRSDEWKPGYMKTEQGDYMMIVGGGEG